MSPTKPRPEISDVSDTISRAELSARFGHGKVLLRAFGMVTRSVAELQRRIGTSAVVWVGAMPALVLACCAVSALAVFTVARQMPQNSDTVPSFLAAQSILQGNFLLAGWHFPRDNNLFTYTLPFAAFEAVFGSRTIALAAVPALAYALIVAACLAASLRSLRWSRDNVISLATILLLVGLPPFGIFLPLLVPQCRGPSILFSLVSLILLGGIAKSGPMQDRPLRVFAFAILAVTAVASDPFAIAFAFGPALLVLGIEFLVAEHLTKSLGLIALVAFCSALGLFLPAVIAHLGGFVTEPTIDVGFVPPEHLGSTVAGFFFGFLYSSGADIFGRNAFDIGTIANGARLAGWLLGGVAVVSRIPAICRPGSDALFERFLLASVAVVVPTCVLSRMFDIAVQDSVLNGGGGTRYLAPLLVFVPILAARAMPQMIAGLPTRRSRFAATACFVTLAGGLLIGKAKTAVALLATSPPWTAQNEFLDIGRWLEARHLTCGIGEYWSSSIITALTGGRVTVRAFKGPPGGHLAPFRWAADDNWYLGGDAPTFAIWQEGVPRSEQYHVNAQTVAATFGAPLRLEHIGQFTIALLPLRSPQPGPTIRCHSADDRPPLDHRP